MERETIQEKFTKRGLKQHPKPEYKAPYEVHDEDFPGLAVRVLESGRMTFYLRFRFDGHPLRMKLGNFPGCSPDQARDNAKKALGDVAKGIDPRPEKKTVKQHTLKSFIEEEYQPWMETHRKTGKATCKAILSAFKGFQDKKLARIEKNAIEKWRTRRQNGGNKPATVNRYTKYLAACLAHAVEHGFLEENVLAKVKMRREDNSRVRYLSPDERERLMTELDKREAKLRKDRTNGNEWRSKRGLEELQDLSKCAFADHLKPMILLSLDTGLRRGELFQARWDDIDTHQDPPTLTVRAENTKSGKTRHIPLSNRAQEVLKGWKAQTSGEGLLFPSKDGTPFDNVNSAWRKFLHDAKVDNFHWHDMRHDFASSLVMKGADLYVVKELLGHSTIQMTERYAHLAPSAKSAAVALLDGEGERR